MTFCLKCACLFLSIEMYRQPGLVSLLVGALLMTSCVDSTALHLRTDSRNFTAAVPIPYDVPGSNTHLVIFKGPPVKHPTEFLHFYEFSRAYALDKITVRGHDYPLVQDGDDPLDVSCDFGKQRFLLFARSERTARAPLRWGRIVVMLDGLRDVYEFSIMRARPVQVMIYDINPRVLRGFASVGIDDIGAPNDFGSPVRGHVMLNSTGLDAERTYKRDWSR